MKFIIFDVSVSGSSWRSIAAGGVVDGAGRWRGQRSAGYRMRGRARSSTSGQVGGGTGEKCPLRAVSSKPVLTASEGGTSTSLPAETAVALLY